MIRRVIANLSVIGLAMVASLTVGPPAKAAEVRTYYVGNYNVGHCLAIGGKSLVNGAIAVQWGCTVNAHEQWWNLEPVDAESGATIYRLWNINSHKCLAIGGGNTSNGVDAIQWTCGNGPEQRWKYDSAGRLRNMNSDKCLAIAAASLSEGAHAIQWTCRDVATNPEQKWWLLTP